MTNEYEDPMAGWLSWLRSRLHPLGTLTQPQDRFELLADVLSQADLGLGIRGPTTEQGLNELHGLVQELYVGLRSPVSNPVWQDLLPRLQHQLHTGSLLGRANSSLGLDLPRLSGSEIYRSDLEGFVGTDLGSEEVVFFLGAGASKPPPSNVPLVTELLEEVWTRARKLDPNPLQDLEQLCRSAGIWNIEDVLTALSIANVTTGHPSLPVLFDALLFPTRQPNWTEKPREPAALAHSLETFNTLFAILTGTMLAARPNPIHIAISRAVQRGLVHSVITTNYDACLEFAFEDEGVDLDRLIKVHGSVTWFYCGDCQLLSTVSVKSLLDAVSHRIPYPLLGMCPECSGKMQQFIVPPTALKWVRFPPSIDVWSNARDALQRARLIVVIGYSFGDADDYLARTLIRAIAQDADKRILIIDPSLQVAIRAVRLLFRHLKTVAPGRLGLIGGLGEDAVPLLVDRLLA